MATEKRVRDRMRCEQEGEKASEEAQKEMLID